MRGVRIARSALMLAGLALVALSGCDRQPDFATRYKEKDAMIRASANAMEQDVARQLAAAREAERAIAATNGSADAGVNAASPSAAPAR